MTSQKSGSVAVPIVSLVRRFFAGLDEAGVDWAVLRGAAGLPEWTRYDIDLLIRAGDTDRAEKVLRVAAEAEGWSVRRIVDKFAYRCCMLSSPPDVDGVPRFLPIDFFAGCYHRFYPIADGGYGLDERVRNDAGVWVVPDGFGSGVALLKELTRHDTFKENSRDEVREGTRNDAVSFRRGVCEVLGDEVTEKLLVACQDDDWDAVHTLVPVIRHRVACQRSKLSWDAIQFFRGNLRQHINPPMSGLVVLLGPDGSGKSTIADLVGEVMYQNPFKICQRYEYQFRILPELKQLKNRVRRMLGKKVVSTPTIAPGTKGAGMNRDHGMWLGMMYVTYYTLDFILGRIPLFKLRGRGTILLFARYFHDYYYQLGYGNVPRWYLRMLECLIPQPDLLIYLDRSAEEIYDGKPELDLDEIKRQQKVIRDIVETRPYGVVVDASQGVDATVLQVRKLVLRGTLL